MVLEPLDWIAIVGYAVVTLVIGLSFTRRAGQGLGDFFLGGRQLPWYVAGFSMVATTFAADTPLAVTEIVNQNGVSGNWIWWSFLVGGMFTTFFFAKLWRRADVLTDNELIELRYSGKAAAALRGFKGIYLGLFINSIIIGWVNLALMTILQVMFNLDNESAYLYTGLAMLITAGYTALSGLWGIALTDLVQFVIAMTGCIILSVVVMDSPEVGGAAGLIAKLPAGALNFFPTTGVGALTLALSPLALFAYLGVQWWSAWYPGAEPGGGGYIAQRMMSAKNEDHSLWATLFFQIAHYGIRPWPWIIVGLATIVLYPDPDTLTAATQAGFWRAKYVHAVVDFLPAGLRGLLLVSFLAAYMSTISTQLNWGSSYLLNDVYLRFFRAKNQFLDVLDDGKKLVNVSRLFTVGLMLAAFGVTGFLTSIAKAWEFLMSCGAGLGLVLILRWYWWRINVWSEIVGTLAPFAGYSIIHFAFGITDFATTLLGTTAFTTIAWLVATFITKPEPHWKLLEFYNRVRPSGNWRPVADPAIQRQRNRTIKYLALCTLSGVAMVYGVLFGTGHLIFNQLMPALYHGLIALGSGLILAWAYRKTRTLENS